MRRCGRSAPFRAEVPAFGQKTGQVSPVTGIAQQATHAVQRLLHRINILPIKGIGPEFIFGANAGIGAHQVQQGCPIGDLCAPHYVFRHATDEEITPQLIAPHQPCGGLAHCGKAFQLKRQMRRQIIGRWPRIARFRWQQQARFQERQPRRHHQIIRRQFKPQILRAGDEGQILLGQLQHRYAPQIHFLGARQHQQQVKRAFKAVDIKDQRLIGLAVSRHRTAQLAPIICIGFSHLHPALTAAKIRLLNPQCQRIRD